MLNEIIKCPHCGGSSGFKLIKRAVQIDHTTILPQLSAVACKDCDKLVGFHDTNLQEKVDVLEKFVFKKK